MQSSMDALLCKVAEVNPQNKFLLIHVCFVWQELPRFYIDEEGEMFAVISIKIQGSISQMGSFLIS